MIGLSCHLWYPSVLSNFCNLSNFVPLATQPRLQAFVTIRHRNIDITMEYTIASTSRSNMIKDLKSNWQFYITSPFVFLSASLKGPIYVSKTTFGGWVESSDDDFRSFFKVYALACDCRARSIGGDTSGACPPLSRPFSPFDKIVSQA